MRPITRTVSATGSSTWIPVNNYQENFNLGLQVVVSAGATLSWVVQVTSDDIFDSTVTPTATAAPAPMDAGTATEVGNLTIPVRAVRLNATITTGTATLTVIQGA